MTARPRCACCGKPLPYATQIHRAPTEADTYLPVRGWRYQGNLQVISKRYVDVLVRPDDKPILWDDGFKDEAAWNWKTPEQRAGTRERRLSEVSTWDGEKYQVAYWPFCTQRCAGSFAEQAFAAGYRIRGKDAA